MRILLTLTLLFTQLAPASAQGLYVCLACDGSIRVESGAEGCGACHHLDEEAANPCCASPCCASPSCGDAHGHTCKNSACPHCAATEHQAASSAECIVSDACDCLHIPISPRQQQPATITVRGSLAADGMPAPVLDFIDTWGLAGSQSARIAGVTSPGLAEASGPALGLLVITTAVMQC